MIFSRIAKKIALSVFPSLRNLRLQRDRFAEQLEHTLLETHISREALANAAADLHQARQEAAAADVHRHYSNSTSAVLQYRQAHFEVHGRAASGEGLPTARAWPRDGKGLSYAEKMLSTLPLASGKGAEIGPLNIPITSKATADVLYVDHLDSEGLQKKYGASVQGFVHVDRPMVNNSLCDTLRLDAPLDFFVASQVFEHVPNPIRWLNEIAAVLRVGGLVSLSLPDRRESFDLLRAETQPADVVAAYFEDATVPNVRCVYDHHSQAALVNMHWATSESVLACDVVKGLGAVRPKLATDQHLHHVALARSGEYLDVHAWVFTPPSLLVNLAQLAGDDFLPFRLHQFYPTDSASADRDSSSFIFVLEKVRDNVSPKAKRLSFLEALGD